MTKSCLNIHKKNVLCKKEMFISGTLINKLTGDSDNNKNLNQRFSFIDKLMDLVLFSHGIQIN